ncbi:ABC transporter ATP-binding protein [Methylonatrum kenyense]|uniref:ABC transporter ATP-binding protein n=1 Tax=Methylonatrum kenyense TaxID=455253 RepID=UPI0020C10929|nr:ABC transporter ATP-binding protein [Methylonatrum kenyense]MCK8515562.1 ABC transporter ATP-binding protein [Methylonatrum kenyense]
MRYYCRPTLMEVFSAAMGVPALHLQNLGKTYSNGLIALRGIDLTVQPGDFFGLLGPNGAGKSTAIGIISSLVTRTAGRAEIFGHDIEKQPWEAKRRLGVVPQEVNFNGFETVEQIVLNQAGYYGIPRRRARQNCERYLRELDLWDRRKLVSRTLSGGMKRRLMIARALVHEPRLLILDEPTAGVDIELRRSMWRFLEALNRTGDVTVILTTHYLEEAESLCRNIAIINKGRIVENTSTTALLNRLNTHSFILDVDPLANAAPATVDGFVLRQVGPQQLEADVQRDQSITQLVQALAGAGIYVRSLKNKANRLEEMFIDLLQQDASAGNGQEA